MAGDDRQVKRKSAFVSYAQASFDWQLKVFRFTTALRNVGGVDAEIDLFHKTDHQHWMRFGSKLIEESDYTLIAVDRTYRRRWEGEEEKGVGAGVAKEAATIRSIYEDDRADFLQRVKVVLLPGVDKEAIPADLLGECERFPIGGFDLQGMEPLLRTIWGRPAFEKSPLGPIPTLPQRFTANLERGTAAERFSLDPNSATDVDARDEAAIRERLDEVLKKRRDPSVSETDAEDLLREQRGLRVLLKVLGERRRRLWRRQRKRDRPIRPPRRIRALMAVPIVLMAALTGILLGLGRADSPGMPASVKASAGGVAIQGPPGWSRQRGSAVEGLEIAKPVSVLSPPDSSGRRSVAVAGLSAATGPTLLPAAFRNQLGKGVMREPVDVGDMRAYRYTGLQAPGSGDQVTVFVTPTTRGVATLVCRIVGSNSSGIPCNRIASTVTLTRGQPFALGPSPVLEQALGNWLPRLSVKQRKTLERMARARAAGDQADAAESLAKVYRRAAGWLARLSISPESADARASIAAGLRSSHDAYKALATAARQEDRVHYAAAKRAASRAEGAVNRSIRQLKKLGYQVA